ncbi:hypothetical protein FQN55_004849, partial [Onygenales sp. PD_40]
AGVSVAVLNCLNSLSNSTLNCAKRVSNPAPAGCSTELGGSAEPCRLGQNSSTPLQTATATSSTTLQPATVMVAIADSLNRILKRNE